MSNPSLVYLIAYVVVAALSVSLPLIEWRFPRVAAALQVLSALGLDLPRLLDGLRKLMTREPTAGTKNTSQPPSPVKDRNHETLR